MHGWMDGWMDGGREGSGVLRARALMREPTEVPFDLLPFSFCDQAYILCYISL